jgi:hypothetical protein
MVVVVHDDDSFRGSGGHFGQYLMRDVKLRRVLDILLLPSCDVAGVEEIGLK